jgi:hypothetical protein
MRRDISTFSARTLGLPLKTTSLDAFLYPQTGAFSPLLALLPKQMPNQFSYLKKRSTYRNTLTK